MSLLTTFGSTALAAFMASTVEFVEALTIVLAVGVVRGWRSSLMGAGAGMVVLLVLVAGFGSSLSAVPLPLLQGVVGTLLLLFGLRWLRKAILRAAGVLALHDEAATFEGQAALLQGGGRAGGAGVDPVAFVTTFKAVVLEGVEVVFIVVAIGAGGELLLPAALGAGAALLLVVLLGLVLRRPLSSVPENALKFGVGVLLAAFGAFWVGEGLGFGWQVGDAAILVLVAVFAALSFALVVAARQLHRHVVHQAVPAQDGDAASAPARAGALAVIAREAWGLFVDDGWLACGILVVLAVAWAFARLGGTPMPFANVVVVASLAAVLSASALRRAAQ